MFSPPPCSKTEEHKVKIELVVFEGHNEETALAWTCLTLLTVYNQHQDRPSKDTTIVTTFDLRLPLLTFVVGISFVHICMRYSISFHLGQEVSQALGKDNFFSPTYSIMPSPHYVAHVKGFKHSLGDSIQTHH